MNLGRIPASLVWPRHPVLKSNVAAKRSDLYFATVQQCGADNRRSATTQLRSLTASRPRPFIGESSDQVRTHKVSDHIGVVHNQCR